jgi:DNA invertase Pin-like site-specific DNA recombinase
MGTTVKHELPAQNLSTAFLDSRTDRSYGIDSRYMALDTAVPARLGHEKVGDGETISTKNGKPRAVLYARVSTDVQQKEGTIESQVVTLRRQILAAGQELVREYIDDGYSGTLLTRPGLEQLRSDLKADVFDVVHFLAADRIARDAAYQSIIVGELISHGKQIIINGVNYENIPESKVTLTILGAVAEFERAKIIERMMRGKLHRLQKGEMIGGQGPYGYEHVCKTAERPATLAPKEPEATVVRTLFEKFDSARASWPFEMAPGKRHQDPLRQDPLDDRTGQEHAAMPYLHGDATLSPHEHFRCRGAQAPAEACGEMHHLRHDATILGRSREAGDLSPRPRHPYRLGTRAARYLSGPRPSRIPHRRRPRSEGDPSTAAYPAVG